MGGPYNKSPNIPGLVRPALRFGNSICEPWCTLLATSIYLHYPSYASSKGVRVLIGF